MNFEKNIFHPNFHKGGKDNLIQENNRLKIALYIFFFLNLSRAAILKFVTSFGHLGIKGVGIISAYENYPHC